MASGLGTALGVLVIISLAVATPVIAGVSEQRPSSHSNPVPLALVTVSLPAAPKPSAPTSAWLRWSTLEKRSVGSIKWARARKCNILSVSYLQERADMLVARAPAWLLVTGGESITGKCEVPQQSWHGRPEWPFPNPGAIVTDELASTG